MWFTCDIINNAQIKAKHCPINNIISMRKTMYEDDA